MADVDAYWEAVRNGTDLVTELPQERRAVFGAEWDGMVTRGGYLSGAFDFDAGFFQVSPREARVVDPQQRLLLEVVWEAFEDAAIVPADVAPAAGVFVGVSGQDYRRWFTGEPSAHWTAGNGHSFAAGRISHTLDLQGPAFAIDTACSSSLVALHTACRSLAAGDCDTAVAAGVNLVLAPWTTLALDKTGALSPEGASRPFDAGANGFVRGEGCAALVLKRLADAVRDGDRVIAVVDGSAINHDGRSSTFAAPNPRAQTRLISSVLTSLALSATDIGYHEAHGTGTQLGDRIELEAIKTALAGGRLYVGSVKACLGHTEAAAGLLGVIKAALCLRHRRIPRQPHFDRLNPGVDLAGTGITITGQEEPWPPDAGDRASVSSYGMSGTNAYVVLSPAPDAALDVASDAARDAAPDAGADARPGPAVSGFAVSARAPGALRALAGRYAAHLAGTGSAGYPAFAYTASHGRTRHEHTVWVDADRPGAAIPALHAVAAGEPHPAVTVLDPAQPLPRPPAAVRRAVATLPTYPWQHGSYAVRPIGATG
ncbi:beta-ketoacyl synthase [Streptomyces zinciresistens K42]|uniref:Beta-ketoacyl synthase n=1 Tax=Streptomyces zinciresistens K42 TaxID=700597 RepID=G2G9E8_9ACTN|nr:beta-ketoacyl synthase [Streptomyces zinciresistens K42]